MSHCIGEKFKQAERLPADGPINVGITDGDRIMIAVTNGEQHSMIVMSEYNASRVMAALSMILGVRINAVDAKAIRL